MPTRSGPIAGLVDSMPTGGIASARRPRSPQSGIGRLVPIALVALLAAVGMVLLLGRAPPYRLGRFEGDVVTKWLENGREMELLADFAYVDPGRVRWPAACGDVVDGASIPQVFWSFIGGPFEGQYRNASIVHDVACKQKIRDWRDVHRMFYDACRCGGVSDLKARLMYAAVYHFGPRWGANAASAPAWTSEEDFERLFLTVADDPGLQAADIERLSPDAVRRRFPELPERPSARELALPVIRRALPPGADRAVRTREGVDSLVLVVPRGNDDASAERQLRDLRAGARTQVDREAALLESRVEAAEDPQTRTRLATDLLRVSRARAALRQVGIEVERAPPP